MSQDGKLSSLELLQVVTGEEYLEVIKRGQDGKFENFRLSVEQIRTNVGMSAYESALDKGFVGSEEEWLESLKGSDGENGQDVYAFAVSQGFTGSEQDFLDSLKGKSIYDIAVDLGFTGSEQDYLDQLQGEGVYALAVSQGFTGSEQDFLDSLKGEAGEDGEQGPEGPEGPQGKSIYDVAVDNGFTGTEQDFLDEIKGIKGDTGKGAYEIALEGGYQGSEEDFMTLLANLQDAPPAVSGAVFIRDVRPVDSSENVGNKVYANDGRTLLSCNSTTTSVIVTVDAITGYSSYKPVVSYGETSVQLTVDPQNKLVWSGEIQVNDFEVGDGGVTELEFSHNDGAKSRVAVMTDTPPEVLGATFVESYPQGQTELKENDKVSVTFTTDVDVIAYEIKDAGTLKASSNDLNAGTEFTIENLNVANRGTTAQALGFEVRVKKASGAWSAWFGSNDDGQDEDGVTVVTLNNLEPSVTITGIVYPTGQAALREGQEAEVSYTVANNDGLEVIVGSDLEVVSNTNGVLVVKHLTGEYNDSIKNLELKVTRDANGTDKNTTAVVKYATVTPVVTMSVPGARLRSGGNFGTSVQRYVVTLSSTQVLSEAPSVTAPAGTWESAGWVSSQGGKTWTRRLNIHDDDPKGIFDFGDLSAKGASGLEADTITNGKQYTIGGFVKRILSVAGYPNRETDIGTIVTNVNKLQCSNLSKGQAGSLNTQYQPTTDDAVNRYTIIDNRTWYNCDTPNAVSNTSGAMSIEIEELV